MEYNTSTHYFENIPLLQNTLLSYFCEEEPLKFINKKFCSLNYEKYNTHLQPHGPLETYYKDTKTLQKRETYYNGALHGSYQKWYPNNQLDTKYSFKKGKLQGLHEQWYDNGNLAMQCNYTNGNLEGSHTCWYEDGKIWGKCKYKNGELVH